jgi:hypothetical protein
VHFQFSPGKSPYFKAFITIWVAVSRGSPRSHNLIKLHSISEISANFRPTDRPITPLVSIDLPTIHGVDAPEIVRLGQTPTEWDHEISSARGPA